MRKNILTTAMILGGMATQAGTFNYKTINFPMELSNGETIEITLQQELPVEDYTENFIKTSQELTRTTLDHEKMLQLLNKIRKVEEELSEDLPF
jgi:nucleosome binding factor SPN SPT16 subunit